MPSEKTKKRKTKVLIIEDEPALRDIYATKLDREGFEVIQAGDGIEGLDQAIQGSPHIILLDVVLPIKDGFDVLKDLKANPKTSDIPVVILSNLGQEYEVKRGMSLGANRFLTKANLTPARIVEEVRQVLGETDALANDA
jgi:DNA-binding response OmpR family regulator